MERQRKVLNYCCLHLLIMFFSLAGVMAKLASGYEFFSFNFFLFYGLELIILFLYALGWQQIIKKFPISAAYAQRSAIIIWALIYASLFFNESISLNNILGSAMILCGMAFISYEQ